MLTVLTQTCRLVIEDRQGSAGLLVWSSRAAACSAGPSGAEGRYAIDASGNWRITFGWDSEDAVDVDLEDYH